MNISGDYSTNFKGISSEVLANINKMKPKTKKQVSQFREILDNSPYVDLIWHKDNLALKINEDIKDSFLGTDTVLKKGSIIENVQARYRTFTSMSLANELGGIVIGTSDMREVALGWATFNGDHMAMYGMNAGLPKTVVRKTVEYYKEIYPEVSDILDSIIDTPISPELSSSSQATEEIIGKYEITFTYGTYQEICEVTVYEKGAAYVKPTIDEAPLYSVLDQMGYDAETGITYGISKGLPSTGEPKVLVIPVEFTDALAPSTMVEDLETTFFGTSEEVFTANALYPWRKGRLCTNLDGT